MKNLGDCADPHMDMYAQNLKQATSLKTSDRASLLAYMGLPLQVFGKGSLLSPYTPLQQLDILADQDTKAYLVGSTNALLLQQKDRYADVLMNLDENTVSIFSPSLRSALALTVADRRWIDFLTQTVNDTWDEANPSRPKNMGYAGSEEFIRLQFEEYLLAFLSSVKYHSYAFTHAENTKSLLTEVEGDPSAEFGTEFSAYWQTTENYKLFNRTTDSHLFDVVEPRHPCAGGLTIEDVQRRLANQVQELHLDERWRGGREALGKHLAEGQQKLSGAVGNLWADIEAFREAQRKRAEEHRAAQASAGATGQEKTASSKIQKPDMAQAQASVQAASQRAGAYLSSWGAWAAEKRKQGWRKGDTAAPVVPDSRPAVTTVSELGREDVHNTTTTLNKEDIERIKENVPGAGQAEAEGSEQKSEA